MEIKEISDIKIYPDYAVIYEKGDHKIINSESSEWAEINTIYAKLMDAHKPTSKTLTDDVSTNWLGDRWRCAIFHSDKGWGVAMRRSPKEIPSLERDLKLNTQELMSLTKGTGLLLFAGPTGAGKTSTMNSLMKHLDQEGQLGDTVTIEQPVEYMHHHPLIAQREIGLDVTSFHDGIHEAVRHFPKNIVIGEIRHPKAAEAAVQVALSGHRVFATIHAEDIGEVFARMYALLDDQHDELLPQAMLGVCCQHLLHSITGETHCIYETLYMNKQAKSVLSQGPDSIKRLYHEMYAQQRKTLEEKVSDLLYSGRVAKEEVERWVRD